MPKAEVNSPRQINAAKLPEEFKKVVRHNITDEVILEEEQTEVFK